MFSLTTRFTKDKYSDIFNYNQLVHEPGPGSYVHKEGFDKIERKRSDSFDGLRRALEECINCFLFNQILLP